MDEIFMRTWTLPKYIGEKYFKEKDYYSIDELIAIIEDLDDKLEEIKEEYKDFKQDVEDNYKRMTTREQIGYDERTW